MLHEALVPPAPPARPGRRLRYTSAIAERYAKALEDPRLSEAYARAAIRRQHD
jgi:hypothetical protein